MRERERGGKKKSSHRAESAGVCGAEGKIVREGESNDASERKREVVIIAQTAS